MVILNSGITGVVKNTKPDTKRLGLENFQEWPKNKSVLKTILMISM